MASMGVVKDCVPDVRFSKADRDPNIVNRERISAHSHITGLGINPSLFYIDTSGIYTDGIANPELLKQYENCFDIGCGLVGQYKAREAAGIAVDMIKAKKMAGRAILLAGPSGSGKTALAMAIAKEINTSAPFTILSSTEVFSSEVKKTEILNEAFRKSIHVVLKEEKQIYEGEVTELVAEETENPSGGFAKCICAVVLTLKTAKGSKTLRLAPQIHDQLLKEKVTIGDVIYIEAASGQVKRCGRCDAYATEFDLEIEQYVPLPKGEVYKQKQMVQEISLNDLDVANSHPTGGNDMLSLMNKYLRPRKTEITERLRLQVNKAVDRYIEMGIAEVLPGVVYIDEVHMLDIECFTFLSKAMESPLAPIVILATNRGVCTVRGTDSVEPHGIPLDILDRLLIIKTSPYSIEDIIQILSIRARAESLTLSDDALRRLGEIATTSASLRYCMHLLSPANILRQLQDEAMVTEAHISEADSLFMDAKTSAQRVAQEAHLFIS
ncbi:bifunctional P-loop containing nucleoside triphosphate hydrolase/TIP49 [Babesia duncani]|uniref:RuvB-like helicase n=1 Tax=Babesia duncani TaxID=323732 RepID=A0AAD9PHW8_9APIC|nr:bifunctional P-loop containing nucleoside triphosphate hydrolase/TIP49 [Babesia duncani]KAK2194989.1 bifunctional P-loop containing nucleoside triphosphate hydrolase/TIP49 [Babesia duncani]KAK2196466.1 bifunctional P-loop containing nucleoside triphosphate hydrolase/TIP49 [Babesia duncani]